MRWLCKCAAGGERGEEMVLSQGRLRSVWEDLRGFERWAYGDHRRMSVGRVYGKFSRVLILGFFGATKLLPMALDLAVL